MLRWGGGKSYIESKGLRTEGAYEKSFVLSLKNISHIVLYDSLSLESLIHTKINYAIEKVSKTSWKITLLLSAFYRASSCSTPQVYDFLNHQFAETKNQTVQKG